MRAELRAQLGRSRRDIDRMKRASNDATVAAVDRMTLFVAKRSAELIREKTDGEGELERSGWRDRADFNPVTCVAEGAVGYSAEHAAYVELGFQGHFVPFHIAEGLYRQALRWGWRVPSPDQVKNRKPGRRYLIPRGRSYPVWGVFVRGDSQPYLNPAVKELAASHLHVQFLREEFIIHYRTANR